MTSTEQEEKRYWDSVARNNEIAKFKALCARAADALEEDEEFVPATQLDHWIAATEPLIAELRKAAA